MESKSARATAIVVLALMLVFLAETSSALSYKQCYEACYHPCRANGEPRWICKIKCFTTCLSSSSVAGKCYDLCFRSSCSHPGNSDEKAMGKCMDKCFSMCGKQ
ncbi:uncharacterized protein LOC109722635 [Ananas comosus]|uniref:Uncharacterized protein LOC109722635 n=1 Tax=Ananas comosus TaxID=4615 RepID=A0A6P5GJU3_ANACO|nr:uncharacterized protein LOC109722635 [Ananas comosus]